MLLFFSRSCSHHLRPAARLCRFAALRCQCLARNRPPCMHFRSLARSACIFVHQRVPHAFSFVSEFCMHSLSPRARFRPPGDTECMRKFLVNENACNASGAIWRRLRYDVGVRYGVGCNTACDMALLVTEACHSCGRTVRSSRQEQNEAHVFA